MSKNAAYYQLSVDHSLSGTIVYDPTTLKILFLNKQALAYLEVESEESLLGKRLSNFLSSPEQENFLKSDSFYGEFTISPQVNRFLPVLAAVKIVAQNGSKVGILSLQDLSSQKKILRELTIKHEGLTDILEELKKKNQELEALDKAKDKFLSLVTHELRTPLNTIVATSELICAQIYDTEEEFRELSRNLYLQSNHMLDLVNDILDLTKLHSGKMEYYVEQADPRILLENQKQFFADMAENNQVEIIYQDPKTAFPCYYDDVRLKQITSNLLSNAIKFNKPNGRIFIDLKDKEDFVEISIRDTGIGIPADKLGAVFNEFETIKNISNHHKGTGLGLPIVKSLIEGMGGQIQLESALGQGSTFTISVPKKKILKEDSYQSRNTEGFTLFGDDEAS